MTASQAELLIQEPVPDQYVEALMTIHETQVAVAETAARLQKRIIVNPSRRMGKSELKRQLERKLRAAGVRSVAGLASRR